MFASVLLFTWVIYAFIITRFLKKQLTKGVEHLVKEDPVLAEKNDPFRRKDIAKWNHLEMYFCAVFLLPFRLILFTSATALCAALVKVCLIGKKFGDDVSFIRKLLIKTVCQILARTCLFALGFHWIKTVHTEITAHSPTYPRVNALKNQNRPAPLILSNHVSWVDIFIYMTSLECPGFLAKSDVADYPLVGTIAKGLQAIFVQRESKENRDDVVIKLKQRIKKFEEDPVTTSQVLIFPEGTTTNGEYIISFKKGAFTNLTPLKLYGVRYESKTYSPAFDSLGIGLSFLFTLCQLHNPVTRYDLGVFYPDHLKLKSEDDWQVYANSVKEVYVNLLGLKSSDLGFSDKMTYYKTLVPQKKKRPQQPEKKTD